MKKEAESVTAAVRAQLADAHALRALKNGTASPDQQQRALKWIMDEACNTVGFWWRDTDRETAFELGRAFVAKQIGRLLTCDLSRLRRQQHVDSPNTTGTPPR